MIEKKNHFGILRRIGTSVPLRKDIKVMDKLLCIVAFVAGLALPLRADVAIWTNMVKSTYAGTSETTNPNAMWGAPGNWTDANGVALEVAPTNGTHDIRLPAITADGSTFTIYTGCLSGGDSKTYLEYPAVNPSILSIGPTGGVWDTWRWIIEHPSVTSQYRQPGFKRVFTIADASGFDGYWSSAQAKAVYELSATESTVPYMSSLSAKCRPYVRVPSGGTTASLGAVHTAGTVSKLGDGELKVGATLGENTRFTVDAGTLTIEGTNPSEIEELLGRAALHLDATKADTIQTVSKVTDGVEYQIVTNWVDANGGGIAGQYEKLTHDSEYYFSYSHGAFISPVQSPTGLPLVDFGSHVKDEGRFGPSNCWLKLNKEINDPTAVFYAVQTPGGASGRSILGTARDTGFAFLTEAGEPRLFANYYAGEIACNGDIMINGEHVAYDDTAKYTQSVLTNVSVVSVAVKPGAIIGMIGADRHYTSRSCGSRIGELLVFTNMLTRAERVRISQYLTRKWVTGETSPLDANAVVLNGSSSTVSVPDGREARVGEVVAENGVLTKTGGGTLVVGSVAPDGAKIQVTGGAVAFAAPTAVNDSAPAADPYVWLDANDASRMDTKTFDGDERTYVSHWHDHRDSVDVTAIAVSNSLPRMPWIVQDIGNGRGAGVSLGSYGINQSHFILPTWGADGEYGSGNVVEHDTYAGFMVFRSNDLRSGVNFFGSSSMEMMRTSSRLLSDTYAASMSPSAFWSVNGRAADPFMAMDVLNQTDDLVLVAFRSEYPLTVNAIAKDRKGAGQNASAGRITVGEFITYHRPLSSDEFRATEAYLMKKWFGKSHPSTVAPNSSIGFAQDVSAIIDSDRNFDVGVVSGGDGTFVKRGTGAVSAVSDPNDVGSVEVEDGSLALKVDVALDSKALFHFDASAADSFSTYVGDDGKTYLTGWSDVSSNGLLACSTKYHPEVGFGGPKEYRFVSTNPTLDNVVMPDGAARQVVSFGGYRNVATMQETGSDSSSLYFTRSIGGDPEIASKVREIYVVQSYKTSNRQAHFIGDLAGNAATAANGTPWLMRGNNNIFNTTYTSMAVQNGYLALDRETVKASDDLPAGWHLMSVGATNSVSVDSMMHDRNCNAGGGWIAEMVAFDFELTAEQRSALERHLMCKWGIGNEVQPVHSMDKILVSNGSALDLACVGSVVASTLGGGGNLAVGSLSVAQGGSLSFEYRGADDVDHLEVEGQVDLSLLSSVKVDVAAGAKVEAGDWPVLSASGGIVGLDLSKVTLEFASLPTRLKASIYMKDGKLWLRVSRVGTIVIMR